MYNPLTGSYDNHGEIKKARKLKDIDMTEISLVVEPANKRKFLFYKQSYRTDDQNLKT